MGYQASLDYLYSLQRFGIKLGLENTARLLECLGNPQDSLRIVHIAGTNGKGSTAAALSSIFCRAGLQTGLYTSPHLHSFTERIQVNGTPAGEQTVAELIDEIRPIADSLGTTFFEFATALALLYFQRSGVSWAILEVGMGGRLDATNVVIPELTLVTRIGLDHAAHLGSSVAMVAGEKAGIFKPQVAAITALQPPEASRVLRARALALQAPLYCAGEDFSWKPATDGFHYYGLERRLEGVLPGLAGAHQMENLSLALAAAELLERQGVVFASDTLRRGIAEVRWPGRLEWLGEKVLFDGAHNPAGADVLAGYLEEQNLTRVHWVAGLKADKDVEGILGPLLQRTGQLYVCEPPVEEAVAPGRLAEYAFSQGVAARTYASPELALQAALAARAPGETILVAGSLFLVAVLRETVLKITNRPDDLCMECPTGLMT